MSFIPKSVFLTILSTSFSSMIFAAPPPGAGINYLDLLTGKDGNTTNIYANGNMQAQVKVNYELDDNYILTV